MNKFRQRHMECSKETGYGFTPTKKILKTRRSTRGSVEMADSAPTSSSLQTSVDESTQLPPGVVEQLSLSYVPFSKKDMELDATEAGMYCRLSRFQGCYS